MKFRNAVLAMVVMLMLLMPATFFCIQRMAHVDLPAWLTAEEATYLSGGKSDIDIHAEATLEGFASGSFQNALEAEIGNFIPAKASLLLGDAALQRSTIALSDRLFGWGCYPTFYGSTVLYLPECGFLAGLPMQDSEEVRAGLEAFSGGLAQFAARHPDKTFYVVLPDSAQFSTLLPSSRLIASPLDATTAARLLSSEWEDIPNLSLSLAAYDDLDGFTSSFYRTDGHWNGYGALKAYGALMADLPQLEEIGVEGEVEGPVFNGQNSRHGLMLLDYPAIEPRLDASSIKVASGATGWILAEDDALVFGDYPFESEYNFYASWYGGDIDTVLTNDEKEGSALLVSDSFGDAFRWLLAQSYRKVSNYTDLHVGSQGGVTLEDRIAQSDSDTIVFVGQPSGYVNFLDRKPGYFS